MKRTLPGVVGLIWTLLCLPAFLQAQKATDGCPLHMRKLVYGQARIRYGLFPYQDGEGRASREKFPCANSWFGGGCMIRTDDPETLPTYYCPECRRVQRVWRAIRFPERESADDHFSDSRTLFEPLNMERMIFVPVALRTARMTPLQKDKTRLQPKQTEEKALLGAEYRPIWR
jgi:hypothetical protein